MYYIILFVNWFHHCVGYVAYTSDLYTFKHNVIHFLLDFFFIYTMKMFYENKKFLGILNIITEWRVEKTGSTFSWSSRRKSDVVLVTRYFDAITAIFLPYAVI